MSMLTVYGEVKNNVSKEHSFTLKIIFYDDARKIVGTASGAMNNLTIYLTQQHTRCSLIQ